MKRRYSLTPRAKRDLISILSYIGIENENPIAAEKLSDRLDEVMSLLAAYPKMGHVNETVAPPEFRFWPVGKYLIIYRPDTKPLQIIRIWHGAQRSPELG